MWKKVYVVEFMEIYSIKISVVTLLIKVKSVCSSRSESSLHLYKYETDALKMDLSLSYCQRNIPISMGSKINNFFLNTGYIKCVHSICFFQKVVSPPRKLRITYT
jgi:hypothetical protein